MHTGRSTTSADLRVACAGLFLFSPDSNQIRKPPYVQPEGEVSRHWLIRGATEARWAISGSCHGNTGPTGTCSLQVTREARPRQLQKARHDVGPCGGCESWAFTWQEPLRSRRPKRREDPSAPVFWRVLEPLHRGRRSPLSRQTRPKRKQRRKRKKRQKPRRTLPRR